MQPDSLPSPDPSATPLERATLGGGCFWCLDAVFRRMNGIHDVTCGYAGGHAPNPTYREVCTGETGHAEVVEIVFDPSLIGYRDLLEIFFTIHDPTTLNRQGEDIGTQYRSILFYHSPEQERVAQEVLEWIRAEGLWGAPPVTQVEPRGDFYSAEPEHQDYYVRNPHTGYCQAVVGPKVAKARSRFAHRFAMLLVALGSVVSWAQPAAAQAIPSDDPVLLRILEEATERSQLERMGLQLLDSIGPRLTGTPAQARAHDWAVETLQGWGIEARNEPYGTWQGWDRGPTHIDLVEPRVRTLEGMMSAWSPSTEGPVEGRVVVIPPWRTESELEAWLLREVPGAFVAVSFAQPTCRPDSHYADFGTEGALERMRTAREAANAEFQARLPEPLNAFRLRLENAGAAGILQSQWPGDIGIQRIFGTNTSRIPTLELSCEDFGLVSRLAENGMGPRIRVQASARFLGEVPVHNTVAMIRGTELPDEYVLLSAHFDSWDGASGATDNGTGSILMMEAMRILQAVYPNPKRTVMLGLWGGEEQGLNGSRRFAALNPEVSENLQALFNQDNGTGRVIQVSMQGLVEAGAHWGRWLSQIPESVSRHIDLQLPGIPGAGGTDHAAFICSGAPAFNLSAHPWSYFTHTWHTNRDTFDKVVFEEVRNNAILVASLAYLASEDPDSVSRARRVLPLQPQTGAPMTWPQCQPGMERFGG